MIIDMFIKKGTLIRMGDNPAIRDTARGLLIRLINDATWGQEVHADVIENPNGWHHEDIYHELNSDYDTIQPENNAQAARQGLDKI